MTKQEQKELSLINDCIEEKLSVEKLCKKLKVTRAGLGHRIIRLNRLSYQEKTWG